MEETKTKNQNVPTLYGTIIILIIAVTVGMLVRKWEKQQSDVQISNINISQNATTSEDRKKQSNPDGGKQITQLQSKSSNAPCASQVQPIMPSLKNETQKTPNQIVADFYNWYIGTNEHWLYQMFILNQKTDLANPDTFTRDSVFVSSNYEQNIVKKRANGDSVLCTQDTNCNVVKNYGNAQISGNNAEVDILRGYLDSYANQYTESSKIKVMLKKENGQWKIDDIICGK